MPTFRKLLYYLFQSMETEARLSKALARYVLLEKRMRDAKINEIFEGTGQIIMLVIVPWILGFSREQLK